MCTMQDSNPRPSACKSGALPTEQTRPTVPPVTTIRKAKKSLCHETNLKSFLLVYKNLKVSLLYMYSVHTNSFNRFILIFKLDLELDYKISANEIYSAIGSSKYNKSCGLDSLLNEMLKFSLQHSLC